MKKTNKLSCSFVECWHYGVCRFTDDKENKDLRAPDVDEITRKPKCFLAQDWFSKGKKIKEKK